MLTDNEAGLAGLLGAPQGQFSKQIKSALQSNNPGIKLEGEVAQALENKGLLKNFQHKLWNEPTDIGEIDIETPNYIIEVASGAKPNKINQLTKLQNNTLLNPNRKPVILFAPKVVKPQQIKTYQGAGVKVINDLDQLFEFGEMNGGL